MDHKEVIPDSHQEYDDEFEESEDEYDKEEDDEEEDDEEEEEDSETTGSEPVYTPLLPDHEEEELAEEVGVDDMESVEGEEAATSNPLLQYRFSKEEKQGGELVGVEKNSGGEGLDAREMLDQGEDENDKEMLDLVVPFVSIVITQPTPELERRTREGCLEEDHHDEEDDEMLPTKLDDDHDKENTCSSNQHESCSMVGVPSIIVTPVTPELSQKVFESDRDVGVESEEELEKATIDNNEDIVEEARDSSEKIKTKGGIRFSQDSKPEEEDKINGNCKERLRRRSSLFSSVSKATSILRCAIINNYLRIILVFGSTFSISIFTSCFPPGDQ